MRVAGALDVAVTTLLKGVPGGAEVSKADGSVTSLLAERQPLRLVQAFVTIEDKAVRRSLVELAESVARLVRRNGPSRSREALARRGRRQAS